MLQPRAQVVHTESVFFRNHVAESKRKSLAVKAPTGQRSTVLIEYGLVDFLTREGGDVGLVPTARDVELRFAGDVAQKAHATVAQDAALLVEDECGADVLRFFFAEAREVLPALLEIVLHVVILERTLARLVANGTVERVVQQQHFFDRRARLFGRFARHANVHSLRDRGLA